MFSKITVHRVGNKINGESLTLSQQELQLDEDMTELLGNYFINAFKSEEQFQFYSDSYLVNNPVYSSVSEIFEDKAKFQWESENIAKHLYEAAENPRVQAGELFVVYFEGEVFESADGKSEKTDSVGIFKTEKREGFLKINPQDESFEIERDFGISLSKIDKAALIYNSEKESGYVLSVIDNNKNGDIYYWFEDFLKVKQRDNEYFHTQETLSVYKDFITQKLPEEFEVSKADQADFLNKSINFFKEKEEFKYDDFVKIIMAKSHTAKVTGNDGTIRSITWEPTNFYATGDAKKPDNVTVIGGKTGTTQLAGNCLILLTKDKNDHPYISIVMKADTKPLLYKDMTAIVEAIPENN